MILTIMMFLLHINLQILLMVFYVQYSDQAEAERASILENFRQETTQWNKTAKATNIAESSKLESTGSKISIIVATDACLPQAAMAEAPLMARVLINYELPTKKVSFNYISVHICCF
jgi:translation initiation factor 4A